MARISSPPPEPAPSTDGLAQTFAASLVALLLGLAAIFYATDDGHAFTTESLRRSEISRQPEPIPKFQVVDASGGRAGLREWVAASKRTWIVDFVYTRCQTVCSSLGSVYQQLQEQVRTRGLTTDVGLLTISFDPARDGPTALAAYARRMQMDPGIWTIVGLESAGDRRRLLEAFGIMVIPAPLGEFEHNAALHIVDRRGRLVRIMDYDAPTAALDFARSLK